MADNNIFYSSQPIMPITQPVKAAGVAANKAANQTVGASFSQVLAQEISGVKFSQHALQRLQSRNINLAQEQLQKIGSAVDKAAQKGARESLVLMDNLAFVVSIKNKTVITAMDGASIKDNVFTNIDSAVIV